MGLRVALVVHPTRQHSLMAAQRVAALLDGHGALTAIAGLDEGFVLPEALADVARVDGDLEGVDVVLTLGGDGTFLRGAHLAHRVGVPVLGVNLGRLGFLAEVEPDDLEAAVAILASGAYEIDERRTLTAVASDEAGRVIDEGWALNEVSVEKSARQRVLDLVVEVSGTHLARVPVDAIVVATPTGSTAYSFSAGGPILAPGVAGLVVTPVAPHSLFNRTLVAGPHETVRVAVSRDQPPAVVSCDGRQPVEVPAGGAVEVRLDGVPLRLVRIRPADFWDLVHRKFGLR